MLAIDLKVIGVCLKGAVHNGFKLNKGAVSELVGLRMKEVLT